MKYEISSGNGPCECELAAMKFANFLEKEYNAHIVEASEGYNKGTYRSVTVCCDEDLSCFVGSVLWICKSPYRIGHKRKNWFINFKERKESDAIEFDERLIEITTFRSGGHGGQHVNKVETGVRVVYLPTGDCVVCTDERSQYANKKKAIERLKKIILDGNIVTKVSDANEMRKAHVNLERGNAVAVFEGMSFKKIK